MLRRLVFSSGPILGAVVVAKVDEKKEIKPDTISSPYIRKPSELPLYTPIHAQVKTENVTHDKKPSFVESKLEGSIRSVRVEISDAAKVVTTNKKHIDEAYQSAKTQTKFIYDYLNEEQNTIPRVGAVALGGLTGIIFGLRGGIIRRTFYGSIGAGIIASLCYPKEAEKYAQHGLVEAKKYANIAINFAYGVKPGDEAPPINFPKIPTNLSELGDSLIGIAKSAKNAIFSDKK